MKLLVYTAAIGPETDVVRPPTIVSPKTRYLCFTDHPTAPAPYERIQVPSSDNPRLASRRLKILMDHPALDGAQFVLWHDASYRLTNTFRWLRTAFSEGAALVGLRNHRRDTIYDEAIAVARYGYVTRDEGLEMVQQYYTAGFREPENGLLLAGLLGRHMTPAMRAFNATWWDETQRWRGRDQVALSVSAQQHQMRVIQLPGEPRHNTFAEWRPAPEPAVVS